MEKYYVDLYQTFNSKHGMNLRDGGGSKGRASEETKRKQSEKMKFLFTTTDLGKKISIANKGRILTKEHIEKIRKANLGSKRKPEVGLKISIANKGRKLSEKQKINLSIALTGIPKSIEHKEKIRIANLGKKATKETKMKMSQTQRGKKNAFYGKRHTDKTKNEISKKLKIVKNLPEQRLKNSQSHIGLQIGEKNGMAKIILNTETGIYYGCIQAAADSVNMPKRSLTNRLRGILKNKTSFIYA